MKFQTYSKLFLLALVVCGLCVPPEALARNVFVKGKRRQDAHATVPDTLPDQASEQKCTKKEHAALDALDKKYKRLEEYHLTMRRTNNADPGPPGFDDVKQFQYSMTDSELAKAVRALYLKCGRYPDYELPKK